MPNSEVYLTAILLTLFVSSCILLTGSESLGPFHDGVFSRLILLSSSLHAHDSTTALFLVQISTRYCGIAVT